MPYSRQSDGQRWVKAIKNRHDELLNERKLHKKLVEKFVGSQYGAAMDQGYPASPLNMSALMVRSLTAFLTGGEIRCIATPQESSAKNGAEELELGVNHYCELEDFSTTHERWVLQSLFSLGIMKSGQAYERVDARGGPDSMQLKTFTDIVRLSNFAFDGRTDCIDEADWWAERICIPLVDARDNPMFDEEYREQIQVGTYGYGSRDDESGRLGSQRFNNDEPIEYVEIWELCRRRDRDFRYFSCDQDGLELTKEPVPWTGAGLNPYDFLYYQSVPDNPMPLAPLSSGYELDLMLNRILTKVLKQGDRQKNVMRYSAADEGEAKRVSHSTDGDTYLRDGGGIDFHEQPGPSQAMIVLVQLCREWFNAMASNMDAWAGLGNLGETARESSLIASSAAMPIKSMGRRVITRTNRVLEKTGLNLLADQDSTMELMRPIGRTKLSIPMMWTPQRRAAIDAKRVKVEIESYSLRSRSPDERLADLQEFWERMLLPSIQLSPKPVDVLPMYRMWQKYKNLPEIGDMVGIDDGTLAIGGMGGGSGPATSLGGPTAPRAGGSKGAGLTSSERTMQMLSAAGKMTR